MGKFFSGWRRKVGVLTLIMALASTGFWMICLSNDISIDRQISRFFPNRNGGIGLLVDRHNISLVRCEEFTPTPDSIPDTDNSSEKLGVVEKEPPSQHEDQSTGDITVGTATLQVVHLNLISIVDIPFWSIVLFLTLISAYLLLTKPRPPTPIKITEPTANDGL